MPNPISNMLSAISRGVKSMLRLPMGVGYGASRFGGNGRSWFFGLLPGAKVDYQRLAGDKWKNSVVASALGWISRNSPQAPPCIYRMNSDGTEDIVPHPLTLILKKPNKYYDGNTLRQATYLSLIAGGGNAYWWVKRANNGQPLEFWYIPHYDCWPLWNADSTTDNWIEGYGYRNNGQTYRLENEEVIHFRDGLDPESMRMGLDPLRPGCREIVTDNEASGVAAQLLRNMCIPGIIISPDGDAEFQQPDADEMKAQMEENAGGENRFRPIVMSKGVKVDQLALNPQEMTFETLQDRGEARLCSLIGVSPISLNLTVGLTESTYNNKIEANKESWENCIIPRDMLIASELDTQVLAFYPNVSGLRVGYDYSRVPALQDNMDNLYKRNTDAVQGGWITPNEARASVKLPSITGGDELVKKPDPALMKPANSGNGSGGGDASKNMLKLIASAWE